MRGMANRTNLTLEKRAAFLAELSKVPNVTRAARLIGMSRRYMYEVREADEEFARQWDEAIDEGVETLEAEVHRRGFDGVDKPVTFQGMITDTYKEYSDTLAIFLLKAHRPDRYRDNTKVELTGANGGPVKIDDATAASELATLVNNILARSARADGRDLV